MYSGIKQGNWYDETVEEVADGVYRIPLPLPGDGLRAVNLYLIAGDEGASVCVDSGWAIPESQELLVRCLAKLGLRLGDIERFLVTHIHRDHYTQAIAIRREVPTKVSLGIGEREELDLLLDPGRDRTALRHAYLHKNGAGELADRIAEDLAVNPPPLNHFEMPDDWLRDGDLVSVPGRHLGVVETPGHTPGHVVFHDAAGGLLFAGDHVLSTITPSLGVGVQPPDDALGAFLVSLARVRQLPDALLLPAHGPLRPSVHARVDEIVAHHAVRLDNTLAVVRAGAATAHAAARALTWTRHERTFEELDLFNQSLAVTETVAHLRLLEAQERLKRIADDDIDHYIVN